MRQTPSCALPVYRFADHYALRLALPASVRWLGHNCHARVISAPFFEVVHALDEIFATAQRFRYFCEISAYKRSVFFGVDVARKVRPHLRAWRFSVTVERRAGIDGRYARGCVRMRRTGGLDQRTSRDVSMAQPAQHDRHFHVPAGCACTPHKPLFHSFYSYGWRLRVGARLEITGVY